MALAKAPTSHSRRKSGDASNSRDRVGAPCGFPGEFYWAARQFLAILRQRRNKLGCKVRLKNEA